MFWLRAEYPFLKQPNREFKTSFAVYTGHEVRHSDISPAAWFALIPATVENEELRAWYRTVVDFVEPLRDRREPIESELINLSDMLRQCGRKLSCRAFEMYIRQSKIYRK
jgi:hypothetical protein